MGVIEAAWHSLLAGFCSRSSPACAEKNPGDAAPGLTVPTAAPCGLSPVGLPMLRRADSLAGIAFDPAIKAI